MENIKLVIWDMDDTFWKGTISEGNIEVIEENIELVRMLTNRGIINSIVSKNNFEVVKNKLMELDIWSLFVFPKIDWIPKGQLIADLISEMQLRDINVIFIDDNVSNLQEAQFYNKNLNVVGPEFIDEIKNHPSFKGKDDLQHSRLKHYKILENKVLESKKFSDNKEFLIQSEIRVNYIYNLKSNSTRILELINRTNQLNYTKKRINEVEFDELINNVHYNNFAVEVEDKYGYYGIVGFVSLDIENEKINHFLFSCRTINLGIEQYVYSDIGYPVIDVVGDVIYHLDFSRPNWIKSGVLKMTKENIIHDKKDIKISLLFKGGCDLSQMNTYLTSNNLEIFDEMNYVLKDNNAVHTEHTLMLKNSINLEEKDKLLLSKSLPFFDENAFETKVFDQQYDILVYSLLMDYTQEIYINKNNGIKIPYGGYNNIINMNPYDFEEYYKKRNILTMNREFHNYFVNNYDYMGQISPHEFLENLKFIRKRIDKPIIFVNGAEQGLESEKEEGSLDRHKKMNEVLDKFVSENDNTYLLDIRKVVNSKEDTTDNIRHYRKKVYFDIASELINIVQEISAFNAKIRKSYLSYVLVRLLKRAKNKVISIFKMNRN